MTETKESTTYSERMEEAFPDINEEQKAYRDAEMQRYVNRYFAMMKALTMGRTHHVRVNSWGNPEPHRPDGSPMTKPSRASRATASHKKEKAARHARVLNR